MTIFFSFLCTCSPTHETCEFDCREVLLGWIVTVSFRWLPNARHRFLFPSTCLLCLDLFDKTVTWTCGSWGHARVVTVTPRASKVWVIFDSTRTLRNDTVTKCDPLIIHRTLLRPVWLDFEEFFLLCWLPWNKSYIWCRHNFLCEFWNDFVICLLWRLGGFSLNLPSSNSPTTHPSCHNIMPSSPPPPPPPRSHLPPNFPLLPSCFYLLSTPCSSHTHPHSPASWSCPHHSLPSCLLLSPLDTHTHTYSPPPPPPPLAYALLFLGLYSSPFLPALSPSGWFFPFLHLFLALPLPPSLPGSSPSSISSWLFPFLHLLLALPLPPSPPGSSPSSITSCLFPFLHHLLSPPLDLSTSLPSYAPAPLLHSNAKCSLWWPALQVLGLGFKDELRERLSGPVERTCPNCWRKRPAWVLECRHCAVLWMPLVMGLLGPFLARPLLHRAKGGGCFADSETAHPPLFW